MIAVGFSIGVAFLYRLSAITGFEFKRWRNLFLILLVYVLIMTPLCASFLYAMLYDPVRAELEVAVNFLKIMGFNGKNEIFY